MKTIQTLSKRFILLVVILLGLGGAGWKSWAWWQWANTAPAAAREAGTKPIKLEIRQGTSAQEIGQDLQALGVIRSSVAWGLLARWMALQKPEGGFQAGIYQLSPNQSMATIANQIWNGEVVRLKFTIPEGWTLQQIAAYLEQQGFFSAQEFLTAAETLPLTEYSWLPQRPAAGFFRLEGYLYPDTYELASTTLKPEDVIKQMLDRFQQIALPLYLTYPGKSSVSLAEWVTLASIVEKEAVIPAERSLIAGVFWNRLRKAMPLGADPTVEYGLGVQQTPDRPLTYDEVRTPSPYNTYINEGLPPTPIASPGIASLKATLAPEKTDYLFFVARYDGTHVFSRTLAEHQAAQNQIHDQRQQAKPAPPGSNSRLPKGTASVKP